MSMHRERIIYAIRAHHVVSRRDRLNTALLLLELLLEIRFVLCSLRVGGGEGGASPCQAVSVVLPAAEGECKGEESAD